MGVTLGVAQRFDLALVQIADQKLALADQSLRGSYHHAASGQIEDDDTVEWVIPVRWLGTRPLSESCWEKGMFANQNPVCELRQEFTLDRLAKHFGLDGDDA